MMNAMGQSFEEEEEVNDTENNIENLNLVEDTDKKS